MTLEKSKVGVREHLFGSLQPAAAIIFIIASSHIEPPKISKLNNKICVCVCVPHLIW